MYAVEYDVRFWDKIERVSTKQDIENIKFKKKDKKIIYQVENSKLIRLIAPEVTIVEIRDKLAL